MYMKRFDIVLASNTMANSRQYIGLYETWSYDSLASYTLERYAQLK